MTADVLELLLAPLALPLLNARHRFRRPASRSRARARRRSTLGPSGSAPASFAARPARRLGPRTHAGRRAEVSRAALTAASRLSSPPIPRSGAIDIGRPPRAQSACPLDQAPGLLSQRSRNHQIPSSTSFRATDATGTGNRPEVRSGARTPRATHNQPGTPASLLPRDHDGAGSPEQWTSVPVPALVTAEAVRVRPGAS